MNTAKAADQFERWIKRNAKPIKGWDENLLALNAAIAGDLQAEEALRAEIERANRRELGIDLDYDAEPSCCNHKTYVQSMQDGSTKVVSYKIACGKATCKSCFRRLVVPKWTYKVIGMVAKNRELYVQRIEGETIVDVEDKLRKAKQQIMRAKGLWIVIWQETETASATDHRAEVVLFSTVKNGEPIEFFPLFEPGQYERLAGFLRSLVGNIDRRLCRPIRFHRDYSQPEQPSVEEWQAKFYEVCQRDGVWFGIVDKTTAARIHKECRASRKPNNRNYIGFRLPDGREAIATDLAAPNCEASALPPSLAKTAIEADWLSSGGWRPKQRFYEEAVLIANGLRIRTPSELREVTKTKDIESNWRSPIMDGASAYIDEKNSPEKILQAILRNPKKSIFKSESRNTLLNTE